MKDEIDSANKCKKDLQGNCQHIQFKDEAHDSWTIPSGIHYISGITVFVAGSSSEADINLQSGDNLHEDLQRLADASRQKDVLGHWHFNQYLLLNKVATYIRLRDKKIAEANKKYPSEVADIDRGY